MQEFLINLCVMHQAQFAEKPGNKSKRVAREGWVVAKRHTLLL